VQCSVCVLSHSLLRGSCTVSRLSVHLHSGCLRGLPAPAWHHPAATRPTVSNGLAFARGTTGCLIRHPTQPWSTFNKHHRPACSQPICGAQPLLRLIRCCKQRSQRSPQCLEAEPVHLQLERVWVVPVHRQGARETQRGAGAELHSTHNTNHRQMHSVCVDRPPLTRCMLSFLSTSSGCPCSPLCCCQG
jgi:hypothetical protein